MSFSWQLAVVLVIVAVALAYVARQTWRTWHAKSSCGSGCCGTSSTPHKPSVTHIPADQLKLRRPDAGTR